MNVKRELGLAAVRLARRFWLVPAREGAAGERDASFYDRMYAASADYHEPYHRSFYYFLWTVIGDRLRRAGVRKVLEIGCGPGQLASYLLEGEMEQYTGLDFSPQAIEMARRIAPRGRFEVGDARDPNIHRRVDHDAVICTEVLEHIEDDLRVIDAFLPGKRCLYSVPNFPYESHVRHFDDASAVLNRYGQYFDQVDLAVFRSPRDPNDRFFLLEGVRNEATTGVHA